MGSIELLVSSEILLHSEDQNETHKAKGQVEMGNHGLLKCSYFDGLITFLAS